MPASAMTLGHFIGGQEVFSGEKKQRRNPADTREITAEYHDGTPEILESAISAARDAFPAWAGLQRRDRAEVIFHAAAMLHTPVWRQRMSDAMVDEIGKSRAGADGEVEKTVRTLRHMAGLGTHSPDLNIHPDQSRVHMYTSTQPVGPAGLVTAFNFPLFLDALKTAPALIAGSTVVRKPSPAAPLTSTLFTKLLQEAMGEVKVLRDAKIGPGVINLVRGGPDIVRLLVESQDIEAISFTGSTGVGTDVLTWAVNRRPPLDPRHFVAEMGGQNALVVLNDADLDQAVEAAINGAFKGEGQRCTATSRFVVDETVYEEFMRRLLEKTKALKVGPGRDTKNQIGSLVSEEGLERAVQAVSQSISNGMELIRGGGRLTEGDLAHGYFMEPTILKGDPRDENHLALRREIFGPVAGVCTVRSLDEAIEVVNMVRHRHAASLFTNDFRAVFEFAARANVGMVHAQNPTIGGDAQAPFGGIGGDTSFGQREMGIRCLEPFLVDKTVDLHYGGQVLSAGAR